MYGYTFVQFSDLASGDNAGQDAVCHPITKAHLPALSPPLTFISNICICLLPKWIFQQKSRKSTPQIEFLLICWLDYVAELCQQKGSRCRMECTWAGLLIPAPAAAGIPSGWEFRSSDRNADTFLLHGEHINRNVLLTAISHNYWALLS